MEKVWGVWIEDQTSHNILLSQSLTQGSAPIDFRSMKAERGEETAAKSLKPRGWILRLKQRSCLCNIKVKPQVLM